MFDRRLRRWIRCASACWPGGRQGGPRGPRGNSMTDQGPVTPLGGPSIDYMPFVSVSDDSGQTWSQPRPAPNIVQPWYAGLNPGLDDRGRLLLLDDRRLWISEDDGATWAARLMQLPAELGLVMLVSAVPGAFY